MSLFATFIDEQRPKIIFDTDVLDILGTYEASINLRDEHDNISQYILIVEITSEAEIKPIDNSFPYFDEEEWNESVPVQLTRFGEEVVFQFPEAYDDDFDDVQIELDIE